jgi:hypothetical protein
MVENLLGIAASIVVARAEKQHAIALVHQVVFPPTICHMP